MGKIIHYQSEEGIAGYTVGDVLHDTSTGEWCLVATDGRGVALERLEVWLRSGQTCLGDWRLTSLDVGFDLRAVGVAVAAPSPEDRSVGLDIDGEQYEFAGHVSTLITVARAAGYMVLNAKEGGIL